jgi:hypothetical protein
MAIRFLRNYLEEQREAIKVHKWYLSEQAGRDVGDEAAFRNWIEKGFALKFRENYFRTHHITALDSDVEATEQGDFCIAVDMKIFARNHETGREATLESISVSYCQGNRPDCPYSRLDTDGTRYCERNNLPDKLAAN